MAKERIARLFLTFMTRFVSLSEAQIATMGGKGVEAKVWSEEGIPRQHGWLIERSRTRGQELLASTRYRSHNQLGTLHQILAGLGREFLDAFHLDLCGTLSKAALQSFLPVLPLILKGNGRCLAVTVADARANRALVEWPAYKARAEELFGKRGTKKILATILSQQKSLPVRKDLPAHFALFDPAKAAKREFVDIVDIVELLKKSGQNFSPVEVERYIYVSRYGGTPFRMRTYFFHFGMENCRRSELAFAESWIGSRIYFAPNGEFGEVKHQQTKIASQMARREEMSVMTATKLHYIGPLVEGAELALLDFTEYRRLKADSDRLQTILSAIGGGAAIPNGADSSAAPTPALVASRRGGRRRQWENLNEREQIEWLIYTLELKAREGGSLVRNGNWKRRLKETFGYYNEKLGRSLRSALARTNGRFRKQFVKRVEKAFGPDAQPYLDRLNRLQ